jgi:hypothetical protein
MTLSEARLNIALVVRSDGESLMAEARHVAGLPLIQRSKLEPAAREKAL